VATVAVITTQGIRSLDTHAGTLQSWLNGLTLHLYQNNKVPAVGDTLSAYTECTFDGYAAQAVATWGAPTLDANNNDQYSATDVTFNMTGSVTPNTVYGYYLTDGSGNLVLAENNGAPFSMAASGYQYIVSPRFYLGQILLPV
jgi:hypothetical protein